MIHSDLLILISILSFISSALLTKAIIKPLIYFNILDNPDNIRKSHKYPTPLGGGLVIVIILLTLGSGFEFLVNNSFYNSIKMVPIIVLISLISFLDDIKPIPIIIRFLIHIICAAFAILLFLSPNPLFHHILLPSIDFILAVVCFTAFINIYNFLDGIDGITTIESIHLSSTLLILCYLKSDIILNVEMIFVISSIILGSSLGFLIFNWHPAKIFLGDVGSISLGFSLGICLILVASSEKHLFLAVIIASLYYIADGGLTILIRLFNREKIWQAHLKHFFQKAVRKGIRVPIILKKVIICNFSLMCCAIGSLHYPFLSLIIALTSVTITLINFAK